MNLPKWLSAIFTSVAEPAVEKAEVVAIKTGLQKLHDVHPEEYKATMAVETAEIKKLKGLVSESSELVRGIVGAMAQAFTESAVENGVDVAAAAPEA